MTLGPQPKNLSLRQLKDTIEEIYKSKWKHNKMNNLRKIKNETMEQHVETFLSNKFGLRRIIHEWMHCIFSAVQNYAMEDCEIGLFSKILNNDIDEDYKLVLNALRENIDKSLKNDIMNLDAREYCTESSNYKEQMSHYTKAENHRQSQIDAYKKNMYQTEIQMTKMSPDSPRRRMYVETKEVQIINEEPDLKVISKPDNPNLYCYTQGSYTQMKDEFNLIRYGSIKMDQAIRIASTIVNSGDINKLGAIIQKNCNEDQYCLFEVLEKIILDFLINHREKLLSKVCRIFASLDHDDDGCINRKDLADALAYIDPTNILKLKRDEFISMCDPYNTNVITFTDYAKILIGIRVRVNDPKTHQMREVNVVKFTWF